jgi:hypothetical protein
MKWKDPDSHIGRTLEQFKHSVSRIKYCGTELCGDLVWSKSGGVVWVLYSKGDENNGLNVC